MCWPCWKTSFSRASPGPCRYIWVEEIHLLLRQPDRKGGVPHDLPVHHHGDRLPGGEGHPLTVVVQNQLRELGGGQAVLTARGANLTAPSSVIRFADATFPLEGGRLWDALCQVAEQIVPTQLQVFQVLDVDNLRIPEQLLVPGQVDVGDGVQADHVETAGSWPRGRPSLWTTSGGTGTGWKRRTSCCSAWAGTKNGGRTPTSVTTPASGAFASLKPGHRPDGGAVAVFQLQGEAAEPEQLLPAQLQVFQRGGPFCRLSLQHNL